VAAVDLSSERLDGTAKLAAAGDRLSTHVLNVTDTDAVNALPQAVIDAHGQVDGVLNVAGIIQKFEPFIELEAWSTWCGPSCRTCCAAPRPRW